MDMTGKKDYGPELQALIPKSLEVANTSGIDEALSQLLALEKKARFHHDHTTLKEVCLHMVRMCRERNDWARLNSTLSLLNRRRAQHKSAISAIVEEACTYLEQTPEEATKVELIKTLQDICQGKMYVEAQDANLHLMLAHIKEKNGDLDAACQEIQDVHVETFGSLSKKEKAEYILEQMRLNLANKDFVRMLIQSRKMNVKILEEDGFEEVKVKFYEMMIDYHTEERNEWEICLCYHKIYSTACAQNNVGKLIDALQSCAIFLLLSPWNNEQSDMMHRVRQLKDLSRPELAAYREAVIARTTREIIPHPYPQQAILEVHPCMERGSCGGAAVGSHRRDLSHRRILQHNLRIVAGYYTRIHSKRLAEMLSLVPAVLEKELSEMASNGDAHVKIDRPSGIISFERQRAAEEILSDWGSDIAKMLNIMEGTCHLINREMMVHEAASASR